MKVECLQTLNLDRCYDLKTWPKGFSKLASLRHLRIFGCRFNDMPSGFGKMVSLRELNVFVVGESNGVDALAALDLRGGLVIKFYRWHRNTVLEARRVNLKDNRRLICLTLNLEFREVEVTPASSDMELFLECLMLPPNLKSLTITDYIGERFPSWMVQELPCFLPKLVSVNIEDCKSCRQLPRFSQIPHLKSLSLLRLEAVEYIEENGWGGDGHGESCSPHTSLP